MKHPFRFLVFLILLTGIGCNGDKSNYAKVKGTVSLDGKPIDKGQIYFRLEGKPATFMDIIDGKYSGQAMVGSNTISVSVTKKTGAPPRLPPQAIAQMKAYKEKSRGQGGADPNATYESTIDIIPREWGAASKQVRVVEAGAANDFEFSISTKK